MGLVLVNWALDFDEKHFSCFYRISIFLEFPTRFSKSSKYTPFVYKTVKNCIKSEQNGENFNRIKISYKNSSRTYGGVLIIAVHREIQNITFEKFVIFVDILDACRWAGHEFHLKITIFSNVMFCISRCTAIIMTPP